MTLWKTQTTLDQLKERSKNTLIEHLGIEYLEIGDVYLKAKMPVDYRFQCQHIANGLLKRLG